MKRCRGKNGVFSPGVRSAEGVQGSQSRTERRGNAVAVPLFAVRAAAQGDVILRGCGELKCRVTKGRTVQRQAARNRHTVNAKPCPSRTL